jgi:hypothetical protein
MRRARVHHVNRIFHPNALTPPATSIARLRRFGARNVDIPSMGGARDLEALEFELVRETRPAGSRDGPGFGHDAAGRRVMTETTDPLS